VLLLVSGYRYPTQLIGVVDLSVGVGELAAAWEFWRPTSAEGPSRSWRVGAVLTGVAGALGGFVLLWVLAQAAISALII
jgi:hypothetical protein